MAKAIHFKYDGTEYTLEFNRNSVVALERHGFDVTNFSKAFVTNSELLFEAAFKMHHGRTKPEVIEEIFKKISDKEKLVGKLLEMYAETMESLFDEPDEGNVEWEVG